jgi:hypothetical protein
MCAGVFTPQRRWPAQFLIDWSPGNQESWPAPCPEKADPFVVSMKLKEKLCVLYASAMAVMVAVATSTGVLTALVIKESHPKNGERKLLPRNPI